MDTVMMPPGALRLRTLYPLIDGDGSCTLIYDLERAAVLDVPAELQFHVAPALETGDLDEDLLSWLVAEDLYTSERFADGAEDADPDLVGDATWPGISRHEGEFHAHLEPDAGDVPGALDLAFKQGMGAARVVLHLSWDGAFPGDEALSQLLVEASRRASLARQEVRFELALDAWMVDLKVARYLADHPQLHVRLHCGTFPALAPDTGLPGEDIAWSHAEHGVRLLSGMAERLYVQTVLAGPARLHDLWVWAQQWGVRHLDATCLEGPRRAVGSRPELRQYRGDLLALSDEVCAALEDGRTPVEYQPLTRAVRRLMGSEPAFSGGLGESACAATAAATEGSDRRLLGDLWRGLDEGEASEGVDHEASGGLPCVNCWARYICHHSLLGTRPAETSDRREPSAERCSYWRIEAEAALRLYHRLSQVDVLQVRRLFEEASELPCELGSWRGGWQQKVAF